MMVPNWTAASTMIESSRNTGDKLPASHRSCTLFHSAGSAKDFFHVSPPCSAPPETAIVIPKQLVVFISVILQKKPGVSRAQDIKRRLANRLEHWEKGSYWDLVNDVIGNAQGRTCS
jgi:hypothetical protein